MTESKGGKEDLVAFSMKISAFLSQISEHKGKGPNTKKENENEARNIT